MNNNLNFIKNYLVNSKKEMEIEYENEITTKIDEGKIDEEMEIDFSLNNLQEENEEGNQQKKIFEKNEKQKKNNNFINENEDFTNYNEDFLDYEKNKDYTNYNEEFYQKDLFFENNDLDKLIYDKEEIEYLNKLFQEQIFEKISLKQMINYLKVLEVKAKLKKFQMNKILIFLSIFIKNDNFPSNFFLFEKKKNELKIIEKKNFKNNIIKKTFYCANCNILNPNNICTSCNDIGLTTILERDIEQNLQKKLDNEKYLNEIIDFKKNTIMKYEEKQNNNLINDFNYSPAYKNFLNQNIITYNLFFDGLILLKKNFYVVLIKINDIKKYYRNKKINIMIGLLIKVGKQIKKKKKKINFSLITKNLFLNLKKLEDEGFFYKNNKFYFKLFAFISDIPARNSLINLSSHNGFFYFNF
jgi:hypothetical protein